MLSMSAVTSMVADMSTSCWICWTSGMMGCRVLVNWGGIGGGPQEILVFRGHHRMDQASPDKALA
jgi:hypothetical protein